MLLQVIEPGGALDIGQRLRAGTLLPFEDLTAADGPFELLHELDHVVLDHPVQVDQLAVDVVDDFGPDQYVYAANPDLLLFPEIY